jgi:NAD(P)-dependent dehydrogenase (short-subunit alcohol dehydrogenase family)
VEAALVEKQGKAVLCLTAWHQYSIQAFLPLLGADPTLTGPPGRVVNITSTLGRVTLPFLGPYCASKHAMEAVSDSMRREFKIYGVDVIAIAPGGPI